MVLGVPIMLLMFAFVALQFYFAGTRQVVIDGADSTATRTRRAAPSSVR